MTIIALQRRLQNMSVTVSAQHPGLVSNLFVIAHLSPDDIINQHF